MVNSATKDPLVYNAGEFPASNPQVYINDKLTDVFTCVSIENTAGTAPGKAMLRFMPERLNGTGEATSPNTLSAYDNYIIPLFGSRVAVVTDEATLFAGHLMRREDNGQNDAMMFTALDDREMLAKIPVRGAVVRDEYKTGSVYLAKFLTRYNTSINPNGLWNCIGHTVNISGHPLDGEIVPVFAPRAYRRQNYDSPDATFSDNLKEGVIVPWTPRRMLQYLWFIAHIGVNTSGNPDIQGLDINSWRSLRNYPERGTGQTRVPESRYWEWPYDSVSKLVGARPPSDADAVANQDPLDKKLPPMNFQGKALLQAIDDVLTAAGTHNFRVKFLPKIGVSPSDPENTEAYFQGEVKSTLEFFPVGYTALTGTNPGRNIPLLRGGKPSDLPNANTAYDFQLSEDITYTRNAVLVEGDVVRTETELTLNAGLIPAWSNPNTVDEGILDEETAFKYVIWGSDDVNDTSQTYAKYPLNQSVDNGSIAKFSTWVTADGGEESEGSTIVRQLAFARTQGAVQLARKLFPRVYRSFRLSVNNQEITDALDGYADAYFDENEYPQGKMARPILPEQLQFQLFDLSLEEGGGTTKNWLEEKFPIRVQVENNGTYVDAVYTNATSIGNGTFTIDMAENYDSQLQCIYNGVLFDSGTGQPVDTLNVSLKNVKMNLAFPMDHRVKGFATSATNDPETYTSQDFSSINAFYLKDTGGDGYLQYIDSPNGYREEHQVNSSPTAFPNMVGAGDSNVTIPLNRLLPPGSEQTNAQGAAQRRLYGVQKIDRRSSWKMVGIRPTWEVGNWVNYIELIGSGEYAYPVKAPVLSIVHDFQNQTTIIGGLIGETF